MKKLKRTTISKVTSESVVHPTTIGSPTIGNGSQHGDGTKDTHRSIMLLQRNESNVLLPTSKHIIAQETEEYGTTTIDDRETRKI